MILRPHFYKNFEKRDLEKNVRDNCKSISGHCSILCFIWNTLTSFTRLIYLNRIFEWRCCQDGFKSLNCPGIQEYRVCIAMVENAFQFPDVKIGQNCKRRQETTRIIYRRIISPWVCTKLITVQIQYLVFRDIKVFIDVITA